MLLISLLANLAYAAVFARAALFALITNARRQADNCEVAFIMTGAFVYVVTFMGIWVFEPWKMTSNSPFSAMFVGSTIFHAAYFFRRLGALIVGRERRKSERRDEDLSADRRTRRPSE